MKLELASLNSQAGRIVTVGLDRACVLSSAVALAVAENLAVPSSAVEDSESYYNLTVLPIVNAMMSPFIEYVTMDRDFALQQVRQFWQIRYLMANPNSKIYRPPTYGFYDTLCGVGNFVDSETHEFNNKYKIEIYTLVKSAKEALAAVEKCQ